MNIGLSAAVDSVTDAIVTVDQIHHMIHRGRMFEGSALSLSVADTANLDVLIVTGASECHIRCQLNATGNSRLRMYHDAAYSAAGNAITVANRKIGSSTVNLAVLTSGPTITDVGDLMSDNLLPGGTLGGNRTVGSSLQTFEEFVLPASSTCLCRATNIAGTAIAMAFDFAFYEV